MARVTRSHGPEADFQEFHHQVTLLEREIYRFPVGRFQGAALPVKGFHQPGNSPHCPVPGPSCRYLNCKTGRIVGAAGRNHE